MKAKKKPEGVFIHGDCLAELDELPVGGFHLAICDPPFNIGRQYDAIDDDLPSAEYLAWSREWITKIRRVLHKHGSFWLAIGDKYVSELDVLCKELGFHKRGHILWCYTFGVNCARNFTRAHTHWLYYTKTKTKFTFNENAEGLRVPSARQLVYKDKRADPRGRLPDDVWVLRPDELSQYFNGSSDVWLQSRICGTFKEKVKGCDNQIPLPIIERIVLACSNPGDLVIDAFAGTGTTLHASLLHGRSAIGIEQSESYVQKAEERLRKAKLL